MSRSGAAPSATAHRGPHWYTLPLDEDGSIPARAPKCQDGDEILCRVGGEVVPCTVERRSGCHFVGPDGESVEADAIAHPLAKHSRSGKHATPRASVRLPLPPDSPELERWRELAEEEALTLGEWLIEAARAWERLGAAETTK